MDRLFSALLLSAAMLVPAAGAQKTHMQPVFFSMLFPQLIPEFLLTEQTKEAIFL